MRRYKGLKRRRRPLKIRQQVVATQKQFIRGVILLLGITLLIIFVFGDHGLLQLYKMKRERATVQAHIVQLRKERERVTAEKNRLENDLQYIEKLARERYRMVKPGEKVFRETTTPGGILTRIAESHIRVGTFEYFAAQDKIDNLKTLAEYTIKRHFPSLKDSTNCYLSLLEQVCDRQIELIAKWMGIGFIHGVMNTDNTSIVGETIDYGPCAFMDNYDPSTVFSSIDAHGRYAFGNQPSIAQWNMACFANCLVPLIDQDLDKAGEQAQTVINQFPSKMNIALMAVMCKKIGLDSTKTNSQETLTKLLRIMLDNKSDYTLTFRYLSEIIKGKRDSSFKQQFLEHNQISNWLKEWKELIKDQDLAKKEIVLSMESSNPVFIPRNHLVERAIEAAVENNDFSEMKTLLTILSKPYEEQSKYGEYMKPPKPLEVVHQTFCGT